MKKDKLEHQDKSLSEAVARMEEEGYDIEQPVPKWKGFVAGESMRMINLKEDKVYWERKYIKEAIVGLKNRLGIKLTDEYEEKLEKLDDFRPGEDVSLPYATGINKDENYELVLKLSPYFSDDAAIRRFLEKVAGKKDKEIAILVKKFKKANLCTDTSRALWNVLHEAGLFETDYPNWNRLI